MPRVTIQYNSNLDDAYQQILKNIDARFHNYALTPEASKTLITEVEAGEIETNTAHATHAGELYHRGKHIERLLG